MYKSKEVCHEDLSWEASQLLLRRHGLTQAESILWVFDSPSCSFQKVLQTKTLLEGIVSVSIRSIHYILSVSRCSFSVTLPLLCAVAALCHTVQAEQPESAGPRGETSSWEGTKCLLLAHLMVETKAWAWTCCVWPQDHWYSPRALSAWLGSHLAAPLFHVLCAIHSNDRKKPNK